MKLLTVAAFLVVGLPVALFQASHECEHQYEAEVHKCWRDINKVKWPCQDSPLKKCLEAYEIGSPSCADDAGYLARKPLILAAAKVFTDFMCQEQFLNFVNNKCLKVLDIASEIHTIRPQSSMECVTEHIELEDKLQSELSRDCRRLSAGMFHKAVHPIVCKDSLDVPFAEFVTLTLANYTICNNAFEASDRCSESVDLTKLCDSDNDILMTCVETEMNKADACPVEVVKGWKEMVKKQFEDREDAICEINVLKDIQDTEPECMAALKNLLFDKPISATEESCDFMDDMADDGLARLAATEATPEPGRCFILSKYMRRFVDKHCSEFAPTEEPWTISPTTEQPEQPEQSNDNDVDGAQRVVVGPGLFLVLSSMAITALF